MKDLMTVKELRAAIRKAPMVCVTPRFGVSDRCVKIAKAEALLYLRDIPDSETPESLEMYGGCFGWIGDDGTVYLG